MWVVDAICCKHAVEFWDLLLLLSLALNSCIAHLSSYRAHILGPLGPKKGQMVNSAVLRYKLLHCALQQTLAL